MYPVKFDSKSVKIIAHRGLSSVECENSIAAFVAAGNRSYFGIETDVHITKDNKFAIIHDDNTKRVTGVDMVVEENTYKDIKKNKLLNLPYNAKEKRSDLVIPELSEYIKICKHYNKKAVLELKNPMPTKAILQICDIIKDIDYLENTIFISFDWNNLAIIKNEYPKQKAQYLTNKCDDKLIDLLIKNNIDIDIKHTALNEKIVKKLHKHNLKVNCWTCDTLEDAERLADYGVDYITSNTLE